MHFRNVLQFHVWEHLLFSSYLWSLVDSIAFVLYYSTLQQWWASSSSIWMWFVWSHLAVSMYGIILSFELSYVAEYTAWKWCWVCLLRLKQELQVSWVPVITANVRKPFGMLVMQSGFRGIWQKNQRAIDAYKHINGLNRIHSCVLKGLRIVQFHFNRSLSMCLIQQ